MANTVKQADERYEVIIIGGRPAGATLAARLGRQGVRVLLVDRSTFPSLPPVSSPIIYPCTMAMLDEIGADEQEYARATPRIRKVVTEAKDDFRGIGTIPEDRGRDYAYAVDRERFDASLWSLAAGSPSVTAHDGFSVQELVWDGKRVIGVVGRLDGGEPLEYLADVVIGADGRNSLVARKVEAPLYNVQEGEPVTYYYAYWQGVEAYDIDEPLLMTHGEFEGFGYLLMDSADGTRAVTVGGYTSAFEAIDHTDADDLYQKVLQRAPRVWQRVKNAKRVTTVRGLKNVPNFYRKPFGEGWALVGDAAHHKDPLGGQGIYDAVFGAREFAEQYQAYRAGEAWTVAMTRYQKNLEAETLEMYRNTLAGTANFGPSNLMFQSIGRYACESPEFVNRMMRVPTRTIKPSQVAQPGMVVRALAGGIARDMRRAVTGAPSPAAVPPLPGHARLSNSADSGKLGCLGWVLVLPLLVWINGLGKKK